LLDDLQITELNRKYLHRHYPTDVLSFPQKEESFPNFHPHILGDIVISVETAQRQASKRKCTVYEEVARLLIHGVLHLLGYDHERSAKEKRAMQRKEKMLFQRIMAEKRKPF
jgi:probable rRNA maturation factor